MGMPVVFCNSAGCVRVAAPVMGEWEDNMASLAPEKTKDVALHLLVVYVHLLVLKIRVLFQTEELMTSVWELRGLFEDCLGE